MAAPDYEGMGYVKQPITLAEPETKPQKKRRKKKSHSRASRAEDAAAALAGVAEEMRQASEEIGQLAEQITALGDEDENPDEVEIETLNKQIQERATAAETFFNDNFSSTDVETLGEEMRSWSDGLEGTNLANSDKAQTVGETADSLENISGSLDGLSFPELDPEDLATFMESLEQLASDIEEQASELENCEFPGMYG